MPATLALNRLSATRGSRIAPRGHRSLVAGMAIDAKTILDTAAGLIQRDGVAGFSMRGLAEQLGVGATLIYWHAGGRDKLFESLVDRLLDEMASLPVIGDTAIERIACLARAHRSC